MTRFYKHILLHFFVFCKTGEFEQTVKIIIAGVINIKMMPQKLQHKQYNLGQIKVKRLMSLMSCYLKLIKVNGAYTHNKKTS